ncbi:MAG TPA: GNAT family N-acetyltransferase [Acidimicrobiales bacterium]
MHVLDNPVWHALTGPQGVLGRTTELAGRFDEDVGPFGALATGSDTARAWKDLGRLIGPKGTASLTGDLPTPPPGWKAISEFDGVQMVGDGGPGVGARGDCTQPDLETPTTPGSAERAALVLLPLGGDDGPEMLSLAAAAQPGPFETRTIEFGGYQGIRIGGHLVAMAGVRLRPPGYAEVSAVATHPDFRRLGLARQLVAAVVDTIAQAGDIPFLHASASNPAVIRLYESLGFTIRRPMRFVVFQAPG